MTERTGLPHRIADFFRCNPEEWLTFGDMAIKFDATEEACRRACEKLVERHAMRRETMHLVRILPSNGGDQ